MTEAVLLLGPTGVGKSPLGEHLERVGWRGRCCHHFDFGAQLRRVGKSDLRPVALTDADVAVVGRALETGALLEDHQFPIAAALLRDFQRRRDVGEADLVVLNGLPRHVGQARDVEDLVSIVAVVHLDADADTLLERIRRDTGGDRRQRPDDERSSILGRVARFQDRTRPLLTRYADQVRTVPVGVTTTARDVAEALKRA